MTLKPPEVIQATITWVFPPTQMCHANRTWHTRITASQLIAWQDNADRLQRRYVAVAHPQEDRSEALLEILKG